MANRKGMGKGKGSGWKNIKTDDSMRHSMSAKGMKSAQKIPRFIRAPPLKSINNLPVQVSVIVPSTEKEIKIPQPEFEKRIESEKKWFSRRFGGDTSVKTEGSFFDGNDFIVEKGVSVESSMSVDTYNKKRRLLAKHLLDRQKQWKQDTMLMKIEGKVFIAPKRPYIDHDKDEGDLILVS
ncbi:unnamed protein product [marine sediment metagenome]|uniref:Uncharacterized protein n=1 Tax=marine sediment metagenome TaxID=412755 RepID=X0VJ41_9ZZZZ